MLISNTTPVWKSYAYRILYNPPIAFTHRMLSSSYNYQYSYNQALTYLSRACAGMPGWDSDTKKLWYSISADIENAELGSSNSILLLVGY